MSSHSHTGLLKKPLALCISLLNAQLAVASACDITIDATHLSDTDATTTLAEALAQMKNCHDGGVITIADALAGETLQFGTQPTTLTGEDALAIVAPAADTDADRVVVNVTDDFDDFAVTVNESATLTLKNLKFVSDADTLSHALFYVDAASLVLDNLVVEGITVDSNQGLIEAEDSDIDITKTTIKNNQALNGLIYTRNETVSGFGRTPRNITLNVSDSSFENNLAFGPNGRGGAIYSEDVTLEIRDSVFDGNTAVFSSENTVGGAIAIENSSNSSRALIENTEFKNNQAHNHGGAVFAKGQVTLELNQTRFSNNQTSSGQGGAVYLEPEGSGITLDISDSQFSSNDAASNGGAIAVNSDEASATLKVKRSTFSDQQSGANGGVFYTRGPVGTEIINSTLVANESAASASIISAEDRNSTLSIRHSTMTDNVAAAGNDGHTVFMNTPSADLEISHSVFHNNTGPDGRAAVAVVESEYSAQVEFTYWDGSYSGTQNASDNGGNIVSSDDPGLAALQDNGGETPTRMPQTGSSLINAGDANIENEPDTDQRGSLRIDRGVIDIGAVEYGNQVPQVVITPTDISLTEGDAINLDVSIWFSDGNGDDLTYGMQGAPDQVNLDSNSGLITGTVQGVGDYTITITATDEFGGQASASVAVAVQPKPVDEPDEEQPDNTGNDDSDDSPDEQPSDDSAEQPNDDGSDSQDADSDTGDSSSSGSSSSSGGGALFWLLGLLPLVLRRR